MKRKIFCVTILLSMVISCDEPVTVVTNFVHRDGSITRQIEMRNIKNVFNAADFQVPYDSSWHVTDSIEISEKGDTTWVKRAEKTFSDYERINEMYAKDSGANRNISRHVAFQKKFRWFSTQYRFSEKIEQKMDKGYLLKDFLNEKELSYFFSPKSLQDEKESGPDSLIFRALRDSVTKKTEMWILRNLVSGSIDKFTELIRGKEGEDFIGKSLRDHEDYIFNMISRESEKTDSLFKDGAFMADLIGEEYALQYYDYADSALTLVTDELFLKFREYSVRIVMPGKLTGTNGFIDNSHFLLWPVQSEYFLTQPYEMWAESKVQNVWAWIISALFILFVLAGIVLRVIKKG